MTNIDLKDLANVLGGNGVRAPLSGDVNQQIITNSWGGTMNIQTAPQPRQPSPLRFQQLRDNPELRFGPPPFVNRPVRPFGR